MYLTWVQRANQRKSQATAGPTQTHSPKETASWLRDRGFWPTVGLFVGGELTRRLRVGSQRPWFLSWLFTDSVTLLVSDLSVPPWLPVRENEANDRRVTRTKLVYVEFFAPGLTQRENKHPMAVCCCWCHDGGPIRSSQPDAIGHLGHPSLPLALVSLSPTAFCLMSFSVPLSPGDHTLAMLSAHPGPHAAMTWRDTERLRIRWTGRSPGRCANRSLWLRV